MKKRVLYCFLLLAGMASMVSCIDDLDLVINKDDLVGKWHATDKTTEFWRFKSDGSGLTGDEADDVHEYDTGGVLHFTWTTVGSHLEIDYAGQMGEHAYENYTVTRQTQDTLVWKDMFGDNRTFVKVR